MNRHRDGTRPQPNDSPLRLNGRQVPKRNGGIRIIHHIKGIVDQESIKAKNTGGIGIFIEADDEVDTRYDDVLIEGCRIETIDNTGLFWMCTVKEDAGVIVRYNISRNDKGSIFCISHPNTSCHIYNNVIFIPPHLSPRIIDERRKANKTYTFTNNIIYNLSPTASYHFLNGERTISHNVFHGHHPESEPADPQKIAADPLFADPGSGGIGIGTLGGYRLKPGSPCINSGLPIAGHGGRDFWGNVVPDPGGWITDRGAHEWDVARSVPAGPRETGR